MADRKNYLMFAIHGGWYHPSPFWADCIGYRVVDCKSTLLLAKTSKLEASATDLVTWLIHTIRYFP